ncbi:hypothetical protein GCM10027598_13190 [Amycolatopsis oliviviridis]|uniref:Uncharacterized protein n=1 Tax=Amycolatopsis oliviviridis TaxID=1471590 RepID=A0ABQ3LV97_9PSEU|nr:hypothetical protein [Amycolatopsis oliviviridis]GHH26141.1 hypothetical protein GCM10017790_52950 [Amycolatopsis oliviviridis]
MDAHAAAEGRERRAGGGRVDILPSGEPVEVTVLAADEARVPVFTPEVSPTAPTGWKVERVALPRPGRYLRLVLTDGGDGVQYDRG